MAKKPITERNAKKAQEQATEQAAEEATNQRPLALISERALRKLLSDDDKYKEKIDGLTGELRETIGNAKEKQKLNTKAYAMLKKLHRMKSNEELSDLWHTLLAYMDMAGVMKRIESAPGLPLEGDAEAQAEADAEEAEDGEGGGTVRQFGGRAPALAH